ncbi:MAG TPA: enolase C-terminal domain-like protein [Steroidobacteraceae bacterium]
MSAKTPEEMAASAHHYRDAKAIKLKLTGEPQDADRVRAVRDARPDVWLGVDANQGFTRPFLETLIPVLVAANVALIEQPYPVGQESLLDGFASPIPIAADESAQSFTDLASLVGRFQTVNIKLDKCGGLTEGLAMAREAARLGFEIMVGNMLGTSLAMAPSFLLGQLSSVVDLDGPIFLAEDRAPAVCYRDGMIECPEALWGAPS